MNPNLAELISFLANPRNYPEPTSHIEIVQTHASIISLGEEFVYKIKKPVDFEFMDFSTLAKRKFFCDEEIRLNRRLAQGIYLQVIPIYLNATGNYSFQDGEIVEYAIKMKRMKEDGFLSHLISSGSVEQSHFDIIVNKLCAFYNTLPPQDLNPEYGTMDSIKLIIDENTKVRREFLNRTLSQIQENTISQYQQSFLEKEQALLNDRYSEGWIRDTHGDLRLEHFHFQEAELNIYDCIEFKERLRINDLVNDYGFLCMELDNIGLASYANQLYQQLVSCTKDVDNKKLWLFYKTHRACVRGMVHSVAAFEEEQTKTDQKRNFNIAKSFFSLATRYVVLGHQPTVLVISGGVATGKSTIARHLSDLLAIPHVQSDATRKELAGLPIDELPDDETREQLYTQEMTTKTYERVIEKGKSFLQTHNSVLLDGRWSKPEQKKLIEENFQGNQIFWLFTSAPLEVREARLKEREKNKSISDARLDIFTKLLKDESLTQIDSDYMIINTDQPLQDNLEDILKRLKGVN